MKKIIFLLITLCLIIGCTDSHRLNISESDSSAKFLSTDTVLISLSKDGGYGSTQYTGSADELSRIIKAALMYRLVNVEIDTKHRDFQSSIEYASKGNFDYLVYPVILHWEDRATEWSVKPDKVKVKIIVVRLEDKKIIKSGVIDGKSGIATLGGDKPQDLLPEPIEQFMKGLY
ncbi:DUF4823 domain-containing protein [Kangiella profundi]|uniref:DUF4823 domain-containing protein n=1 Tax=Kangiella profundi TaxID=1561924 RepID=A0A2K9A9D5_9GAMM|nr:DUF4823 domain-containing protein [Kangiella profundi]AUD79340.1 DUF4823 domain-containing protein [Kangiella profundi]GGE99422.1 hypothetical protein GCM10011356_11450 [Kangiella profundi]